jgi:transposase
MDVHYKTTTFCLFDPAAKPADQYRTRSTPTTADAYRAVLEPLKGVCRIAYEVGTQAQWVAAIVRPLAVEVQVANPSRVPWLFRDGRKNDRLDARKLATLLYLNQLPTVHLPPAEVSAWRALINFRRNLVSRRTAVKNQVRAMLRASGLHCPYPSCWTYKGLSWLRAQTFDAIRQPMLNMHLEELERINKQLHDVHGRLNAIARTQPNVALLRSIPGVGPRTAEALVAFADKVDRFRRSRQFAAYFGMVPKLDASASVERHGHISKRGPSVVRWVLVEATYQVIRHSPALKAFFTRLWRGSPSRRKKALVGTARKLLTIMFAMLRGQSRFEESRLRGAA